MNVTKSDFFEDIAVAMELWADTTSKAFSDAESSLEWVEEQSPYRKVQSTLANSEVDIEDLRIIMAECFRGFAVSMLTALDGGTALAEKGRIYLIDEGGKKLGEGLHDDFASYLLNSGRL